MVNVFKAARQFIRNRRGATSAEYALLLAIAGTLLVTSAFALGQAVTGSLGDSAALYGNTGCQNNGQGGGLGGGNGGGGGQGTGQGDGNSC
jgi:Flp pilus assembly pilin Flp